MPHAATLHASQHQNTEPELTAHPVRLSLNLTGWRRGKVEGKTDGTNYGYTEGREVTGMLQFWRKECEGDTKRESERGREREREEGG